MLTSLKYFSPIILASFLAGIILFSCSNDIAEVKKVTDKYELPTQTVRNSTIQMTDSGLLNFVLKAGQIDHYTGKENPRDVFSNGVEITTYTIDGKPETTIKALNGIHLPKEDKMEARDSVVLENNKGKKLETELLIWDQKAKKIHTDKFVKIITETEILFGEGLNAKEDFSEYEIQNITGRIKVKDTQ